MTTVLIDDLRSFLDARPALVARTSRAGVLLLRSLRTDHIDDLWLDHDLGGDDTIWPVIALLEEAAFAGAPFSVTTIHVHTANPAGAGRMLQSLRRWHYPARLTPASPHLAHLPRA